MPLQIFGTPSFHHMVAAEKAAFHSKNMYMAIMDNESMWQPSTLDLIVAKLPKKLLSFADTYLLLAECISNAAVHAKAEVLVFIVRRRKKVVLMTFYQIPRMCEKTLRVLEQARAGTLPDYLLDAPGGLGFPILVRLARQVTIGARGSKLQLWFRL